MKKKIFLIAGVVCALLCVFFIIKAIPGKKPATNVVVPVEPRPVQNTVNNTEPEPEPYVSPVDFEELKEEGPDIYAWFSLLNTDISYPVVQHPYLDEYYLDRDPDGSLSDDGSLFTQATYNSLDFEDRVTIIYGHRRNTGAMFGNFYDWYSCGADWTGKDEFVIFLPDRELHYKIFAAVPHSNEHIMYYHDFRDDDVFLDFVDEIMSCDDWQATVDDSVEITAEDHIVILSTCLKTDRTHRFLTIGKLVETVGIAEEAPENNPENNK